jgi:hypothetical protein
MVNMALPPREYNLFEGERERTYCLVRVPYSSIFLFFGPK